MQDSNEMPVKPRVSLWSAWSARLFGFVSLLEITWVTAKIGYRVWLFCHEYGFTRYANHVDDFFFRQLYTEIAYCLALNVVALSLVGLRRQRMLVGLLVYSLMLSLILMLLWKSHVIVTYGEFIDHLKSPNF